MQNILIRADSSSKIGTGHIMRDLVLAEQFKDAAIIFAAQDLPGNINHKIEEKEYPIKLLKSNDIAEMLTLINLYSIDMVIIDHYDINYEYEKALKEKTGVKIFALDDTYEKHYCDILLNHNINADENKYEKLVPIGCEIRCGIKYTLLRDEFLCKKRKKKRVQNNNILTVFIMMGGNDHLNVIPKILKAIKIFNIKANVVTTSSNKNLPELTQFAFQNKWANIHVDPTNIADIMYESDLAIVTPSVSLYEVIALKLPFIAIKTAKNQEMLYRYLKMKRYSVLNKFKKTILQKILQKDFHAN